MKKETKTKPISIRIPVELKENFMSYLDSKSMTLSKWIRNKMQDELKGGKK